MCIEGLGGKILQETPFIMKLSPEPASGMPDATPVANVSDTAGTIPNLPHGDSVGEEEATRLAGLATEIRDQDDLQRDVFRQADHHLTEQANERDFKRLEKTEAEKAYVTSTHVLI